MIVAVRSSFTPAAERARRMEYRGYTGCVRYDAVERMFYGEVMDVRDTITYEAVDEEGLECAFRDAVDEYIGQCRACEQEPAQPRPAFSAAA